MLKKIPFLLLVLTFSTQILAQSNEDKKLQQLKNISNAGAPFLTLKMLDQSQPKFDADLYNWILWEQERYAILEKWEQWNDLLIRIEGLPTDLPDPFKHQLLTKQVNAYLKLGQSRTARNLLISKLWDPNAFDSKEYQNWRKLLVDSYIKEGRFEDARISMRRFQQDFNAQNADWLENRALILLRSKHYEEAVELLSNSKEPHLKAMMLYAQMLEGSKAGKSVWAEATQLAKKYKTDSKEYALYWLVALKATKFMSSVDRVIAYEKVLKTKFYKANELLAVNPDDLWDAYLEYAKFVGNRAELLQGDDVSWLKLAENSVRLTPIKARSIFSYLILNGRDSALSQLAANAYLDTLDLKKVEFQNLLQAMYHPKGKFSEVQNIPNSIRFELVDLALKKAHIEEATRLMTGLERHPEGADIFNWRLRQARVLILGGQLIEGKQVVGELISAYSEVTPTKTDKVIQILFDLQSIGEHEAVIDQFKQLMTKSIEPKQKREILFWMADSFKELDQHHRAALLYLQSALFIGSNAMDPWAQTARYSAAESLAKGNFVDDASRIYKSLLKVTKNKSRRATLKHKIQQLWLNQSIN